MKIRIAVSALVLCAGGILPLHAQAGLGARYGTRDPHACKSTKEPAKGAPSAEQAKEYFICGREKESSNYLYLVEDVKVEVGKGRPYNVKSDGAIDADPSETVYPIRGSFVSYQCSKPSQILHNIGKNCNIADQPQAVGTCYKTSFGDWNCRMIDIAHPGLSKFNVPPPAR